MYKGKTVSLVFPAKNEEENIQNAITDFKSLKIFDEIIVVDNNSIDRTSKISQKMGAKVVKEKKPGYGFAIRKGFKSAKGDYIFLCEPDGTFNSRDCLKLIKHIEKYDMVTGSRTEARFIKNDANMGIFLRSGNIILSKVIQILFKTSPLSDCGCTFRVIKRSQLIKLNKYFTVGKSHFLPELVILNKKHNGTHLEIPVNYQKRIGESKITGSKIKAMKVGLNMLVLILEYRFNLIKSD